jgi:hypothetical protein
VAPLSIDALTTLEEAAKDGIVEALEIVSSAGAITLDAAALKDILDGAGTGDVTLVLGGVALDDLGLNATEQESAGLTEVQTLFEISVLDASSEAIPINGANIAITVPYEKEGDSSKDIVVKYLDTTTGKLSQTGITVNPDAYDATNKLLTFHTTHLSLFAVEEVNKPIDDNSSSPSGGGTTPAQPKAEEPKDEDEGGGASWADNPFTDVNPSDWFYTDVEFVVKSGLFNGVSASSFSPRSPMTRGMIVTVLGRLYGADASAYTDSEFSDVAAGQYYTAYVEWAKENGIVNGVGDNLFAPNANVTRQDFAVILLRYADFAKKQFPTTQQFNTFADDDQIADYAKNAIQTLHNGGIINGVGNNVINPKGSATRAEVAAMLHRFITAANIELPGAAADDETTSEEGTES